MKPTPPHPPSVRRFSDGVSKDGAAEQHCGGVGEPLQLLALHLPRAAHPREQGDYCDKPEGEQERLHRTDGGVRVHDLEQLYPKRILHGAYSIDWPG